MNQIGRYQVVRELGRGAMGVVFEARDPLLGRKVALKMIRLDALGTPSERKGLQERLFREARAAGALSHPGIVVIYDLGVSDDLAYIAMEYVEGATLEQFLTTAPRLNRNQAVSVVRQTAEALDHAHGAGVVHRDVKPSNIMLERGKTVKITDFGIAKITSTQQLTRTGMVVGTPSYMSPEQISAQVVDGRSDQFALAVIAFEVLAGQKPFRADNLVGLMFQIVQAERPSARSLRPDLPDAVDAVLKRGLSKDATERYPSCSAFVDALESSLVPQAIRAPSPRPLAPEPEPLPTATLLVEDFITRSQQPPLERQTASERVPAFASFDRPLTRIWLRLRRASRPLIGAAVAALLTIAGIGSWVAFHEQRSGAGSIVEKSPPAIVSRPPKIEIPAARGPEADGASSPGKDSGRAAPLVTEPLPVENRHIDRKLPGCDNEQNGCARAEFTYVELVGGPAATRERVNAAIVAFVTDTSDGTCSVPAVTQPSQNPKFTPESAAQHFVDTYAQRDIRFGKEWNLTKWVRLLRNRAPIFSLECSVSCFGGGRSSSFTSYLNVDPATGEPIKLASLLKEGAMAQLTAIAEVHFRQERKLSATANLKDAGYFGDRFALNDNYGFGEKVLYFLFNNYEIAPHAAGPQLVEIPYAEIQDLIRPGFPL